MSKLYVLAAMSPFIIYSIFTINLIVKDKLMENRNENKNKRIHKDTY